MWGAQLNGFYRDECVSVTNTRERDEEREREREREGLREKSSFCNGDERLELSVK